MGLSLRSLFSSLKPESTSVVNRVVGIDIGSSSIKVVELERSERAPILRTYGELQLGPYLDKDLGEIAKLDIKQQVEALVDVLRESGVVAKQGVLALSLPSSFVTVVPISLQKGEKLEDRVAVEARKYIPVALADVTLDWIELPPVNNDKDAKPEILLVALLNESLASANQLLQQVEMSNQPAELEIFSALRALGHQNLKEFIAIDLGANFSRLYIVRDGLLERIHRTTIGGVTITRRLATLRNISFAEAEQLKRESQTADAAMVDVRKATASVLESTLHEFKRVIDQYEKYTGAAAPAVFVCGGVAATPQITQYMSEILQRDVSISTPFETIAYPAFMEDVLRALGPSFVVSIGAAFRLLD